MSTKTETQPTKTENIETVQTVELDNVTGGCAACGMANCTMGAASPAAAKAPFSFFNRR